MIDPVALQAALGIPLAYGLPEALMCCGGHGAPLAPVYLARCERAGDGGQRLLNLGGWRISRPAWPRHPVRFSITGPANGRSMNGSRRWKGTHDVGGCVLQAAGQRGRGYWSSCWTMTGSGKFPEVSLRPLRFMTGMVRGLAFEDGAAT